MSNWKDGKKYGPQTLRILGLITKDRRVIDDSRPVLSSAVDHRIVVGVR